MSVSKIFTAAGIAATSIAALTIASAAQAATVAALIDGKAIAWIDTDKKAVVGTVALAGGASLVGMDVRPADGKLYGLTMDGAIVVVDHRTGTWQKKSQLSEPLPAGATFAVDFNPAADRLRVIGSDGTSLRINIEDGKAIVDGRLKFADTDAAKGKQPKVVAVAYTNSMAGTKETALFDIDATSGTLLKQAPPNDGILNTVGSLGIKIDGPIAFDILSDGKGGNTAWIVSGTTMHRVDLMTGAATSVGRIQGLGGKVMDIAVLPATAGPM